MSTEQVASFIAVLLVGIGFIGDIVNFFESAAAISIIISVFLLIFYASGLVAKTTWAWSRIQFFTHLVLTIYYIIAVALVLHHGSYYDRIVAGGVFGIIALLAHLVDSVDNYRKQPLLC